MASDFPSSIDSFPDPLVNSPLNSPSHAALHQDVNDAVEKIETKVGVGVSDAVDASVNQVLMADGSGGSAWESVTSSKIDTVGVPAQRVLASDGAGGAAWVSNETGLVFIDSTTFTAQANPFINGCFTSDYQNYLVKVNVNASASADVFYRFRSGVNTPETGNVYDRYGFYYAGSIVSMISANLVGAYATDATSGNTRGVADINLFSPNEATHTMGTGYAWGGSSGSMYTISNRIETTTQYTGIELTTFAATTLTGTMRVYGYRN